jgi:hypothetical protein
MHRLQLDELKEAAVTKGYATIKRDLPNAPAVPLSSWPGFSSQISGTVFGTVTYYLEGNKVRVHKVLDEEEHTYTMS